VVVSSFGSPSELPVLSLSASSLVEDDAAFRSLRFPPEDVPGGGPDDDDVDDRRPRTLPLFFVADRSLVVPVGDFISRSTPLDGDLVVPWTGVAFFSLLLLLLLQVPVLVVGRFPFR
jgi:hypothetical protein